MTTTAPDPMRRGVRRSSKCLRPLKISSENRGLIDINSRCISNLYPTAWSRSMPEAATGQQGSRARGKMSFVNTDGRTIFLPAPRLRTQLRGRFAASSRRRAGAGAAETRGLPGTANAGTSRWLLESRYSAGAACSVGHRDPMQRRRRGRDGQARSDAGAGAGQRAGRHDRHDVAAAAMGRRQDSAALAVAGVAQGLCRGHGRAGAERWSPRHGATSP